jgi:hypothetical protein
MRKAFEKKLRLVRLRCGVNLLIEYAGRILAISGAIAVLAVLTERLFALGIVNNQTLWVFFGASLLAAVTLWLINMPTRMQVSLLLDERLRLHERFSTTLALAQSQDAFASAARTETRKAAEHIRPESAFPIRPSRRWLYTGATWCVVWALVLFMPQKDLLGFFARQKKQNEQARQIELAKSDVNDTTKVVKSVLKRLDRSDLADDLAALDQMPQNAEPQDIKRQAIRKLSDLSEKVKQMQSSAELESMNLLQQMLKQLPGSADAFSQQLRIALAKGNFGRAGNLLKQMQRELTEGKLSDQQQKALADKLQELARQLQELAAKNKELEEQLEKLGLDKGLAKLNAEQLRQALQKQGLSQEKIEQLLQKAAACRAACSRCSGLGRAMAACGAGAGGLSADELAAVSEGLDELESLQQQLMLTQAALDQLGRACACLGQGMCPGLGCQGPFSEGSNQGFGPGTGGPGQGYGPRGYDDSGQTATKQTKVTNKPGQGPVVASWYFKGAQVRGEARRDFARVIQAGRDSAAEAISENEIPRKYEEAVKNYFGKLEASSDE